MRALRQFALSAGDAVEELVVHLPDDVQHRLAEAVQGGGRLAIGIVGSSIFLELVDANGAHHRVATVDAPPPRIQ